MTQPPSTHSASAGEATIAGTHAAAQPLDVPVLSPGTRLGRYTLLQRIGHGAMGQVFAAYDAELDRKVALKVVAHADGDIATSRREAQALARVSHPHVVTVHDVGDFEGGVFIAMEYLPGGTLAERNANGPRDLDVILQDYVAAGEGLAAAHAAGLVHRDFKPANVLFDAAGRAKVADFGLAARPQAEGDAPARPVGTPAYMAPEQFEGTAVDARADQFALCVALYEAVTGVRPFAGHTAAELARAVAHDEPRDFGSARVPGLLRRAIRRGLSRDPADRFPTMDALLTALDVRRRSRRRRRVGLFVGAIVGIAAVGFALRPAPPPACDGGRSEIASVWSDEVATNVRDAIASRGTERSRARATDAVAAMRHYADDWAEAYDEACRARREPTTPQDERQHLCLMRGRQSLHSVAQTIVDGGAIDSAGDLTRMLVDPRACADETAAFDAMITEPERFPAVIAVLAAVDHARVERIVGRFPRAVALSEAAARSAREMGIPYLLGHALLEHGAALLSSEKMDAAQAVLREAFEVAIGTGDGGLQALVAERVMMTYERREDLTECDRWYGIARASLQAVPRHGGRGVALAINYSDCLELGRDYDAARVLLEDAMRECLELGDDFQTLCGDVAHNIGLVYWNANDPVAAEPWFDRAEASWPTDVERSHPRNLAILSRRAILAERDGDAAKTGRIAAELAQIHTESRGPDHPTALRHTIVSALFHAVLGETEYARQQFDAADRYIEANPRRYAPELPALVEIGRANVAEAEGDLDGAIAHYTASLDRLPPDDTRYRADYLGSRLVVQVVAGHLDDADADFQAFVEVQERDGETQGRAEACWWTIAAVARGDRELAHRRWALVPAPRPGAEYSFNRLSCELAELSLQADPDPARVGRLHDDLARLRPAAKAMRAFADRLLR